MKKILSLVIAFAMVAITAMTAFAKETPSNSGLETLQALPYEQKLDRLEWHEYTELDKISMEDTYTYEEMLTYLKENGFTEKEALDFVGERPIEARSTSIHYSLFALEKFSEGGNYTVQFRVSAALEYLSGSSSPNRIVSLNDGYVATEKCIYDGECFYELVAGNEFYYSFHGTIYKYGTINWEFGPTITVGKSAISIGKISNGNGLIKTVYHADSYYSSGLSK